MLSFNNPATQKMWFTNGQHICCIVKCWAYFIVYMVCYSDCSLKLERVSFPDGPCRWIRHIAGYVIPNLAYILICILYFVFVKKSLQPTCITQTLPEAALPLHRHDFSCPLAVSICGVEAAPHLGHNPHAAVTTLLDATSTRDQVHINLYSVCEHNLFVEISMRSI